MSRPASPAPGRPHRPRRRNRLAWIVFIVLGSATCLLLGWWQLSRWNSVNGTYQNLGYALEWPFFALFLVLAYRRFVRLEEEHRTAAAVDDEDADLAPGAVGSVPTGPERGATATEIPTDILPDRRRTSVPAEPQDAALRAYNEYLAELNNRDTGSTDPRNPHRKQEHRTA